MNKKPEQKIVMILNGKRYDYNMILKLAPSGPKIKVADPLINRIPQDDKITYGVEFDKTPPAEFDEKLIVIQAGEGYTVLAGFSKVSGPVSRQPGGAEIVHEAHLISKVTLKKALIVEQPEEEQRQERYFQERRPYGDEFANRPRITDRRPGRPTDRHH